MERVARMRHSREVEEKQLCYCSKDFVLFFSQKSHDSLWSERERNKGVYWTEEEYHWAQLTELKSAKPNEESLEALLEADGANGSLPLKGSPGTPATPFLLWKGSLASEPKGWNGSLGLEASPDPGKFTGVLLPEKSPEINRVHSPAIPCSHDIKTVTLRDWRRVTLVTQRASCEVVWSLCLCVTFSFWLKMQLREQQWEICEIICLLLRLCRAITWFTNTGGDTHFYFQLNLHSHQGTWLTSPELHKNNHGTSALPPSSACNLNTKCGTPKATHGLEFEGLEWRTFK